MAGNTWDYVAVTAWKNGELVHSSEHSSEAAAKIRKALLKKKHPDWEVDHHFEKDD